MRVTNAAITQDIITRLLENQRKLQESQVRVSTGQRIAKMSDDPTDGSSIMLASGSLRAIEQYRRNVSSVGAQLTAEDGALGQITDLMTRAKEIAAGQYGANATPQGRRAAAAEIKQLLNQAIGIGNTKFEGDFLFGGVNAQFTAPFDPTQNTVDPKYVAIDPASLVPPALPAVLRPTGQRAYEIGAGQTMLGPHAGDDVFVQTGVLDGLAVLIDGLDTNDTAKIGLGMATNDAAFEKVQTLLGDLGARQNQVDTVASGLDALQLSITQHKSDLSEVDMEAAITEMMSRQTAYQAAMMASSKVMGLSLTEYLR